MMLLRYSRVWLILGLGVPWVGPAESAAVVGSLRPALFEDHIIIWKSVPDLEKAIDILATGAIGDGDLDDLLECWADEGTPATVLERLADNQLLRVRIDGDSCEGIIFREEYAE